jgi:hypothetical protein
MSIRSTLALLQAQNQTISGLNARMLADTTIAVVNSQTEFTLTAGSTVDDAYNGFGIALRDVSNSNYMSAHIISDYVGSTKTVTIDGTPNFTIVATDEVKVPNEWPETELSTSDFPLVLSRKDSGSAIKQAGKTFATDTWQVYTFLAKQHQNTFAQSQTDAAQYIEALRNLYTNPDPANRTLQAKPSTVTIQNHADGNVSDTGLIEIEYLSKVYYGFRFDILITEREL